MLEQYLRQNRKTHLIFDFDETLFKLLLPWENWGETIASELEKLDAKLWDSHKKRSVHISDLQNQYVSKHGPKARRLIIEHNRRFETERLNGWQPHHPLLASIKNSSPDYHKYIWSSNTRQVIELILRDEGLTDVFERLVTRDDVRLLKPEPEGFELLRDPAVNVKSYLLVGDSAMDKRAAALAGVDFYKIDYF